MGCDGFASQCGVVKKLDRKMKKECVLMRIHVYCKYMYNIINNNNKEKR
jgi:hypothetical protein